MRIHGSHRPFERPRADDRTTPESLVWGDKLRDADGFCHLGPGGIIETLDPDIGRREYAAVPDRVQAALGRVAQVDVALFTLDYSRSTALSTAPATSPLAG